MIATTTAWAMTNGGIVEPLGMIVTENITVSHTLAFRYRGSGVDAASGTIAHSRYQGWMTGLSSTNAPIAMASPSTGSSRRCQHCHMITNAMTEAERRADRLRHVQRRLGVVAEAEQQPDLPGADAQLGRQRQERQHGAGRRERGDPAPADPGERGERDERGHGDRCPRARPRGAGRASARRRAAPA